MEDSHHQSPTHRLNLLEMKNEAMLQEIKQLRAALGQRRTTSASIYSWEEVRRNDGSSVIGYQGCDPKLEFIDEEQVKQAYVVSSSESK